MADRSLGRGHIHAGNTFPSWFWRSISTGPWPTQAPTEVPRQLGKVVKSRRNEHPPSGGAHAAFGGRVQFDHRLQMTHMGHFGDLVAAPSHQVRIVTENPYVHDIVPCLENVSAMTSFHGRPFPRAGSGSCRKHFSVMVLGICLDRTLADPGTPRGAPAAGQGR